MVLWGGVRERLMVLFGGKGRMGMRIGMGVWGGVAMACLRHCGFEEGGRRTRGVDRLVDYESSQLLLDCHCPWPMYS